MKVIASAGRDRKKDLRDYCHSLKLTAETEEEAETLAMLYQLLSRGEYKRLWAFVVRVRGVLAMEPKSR